MVALLWTFRRADPHVAQRRFRMAQTVSAAGMALGHGLQDAQKTMGVVVMALVIADVQDDAGSIPIWVKVSCALMLSLGTYAGGWRIMRTLGRRIIELDPPAASPPRRRRRPCSTSPRTSSTRPSRPPM